MKNSKMRKIIAFLIAALTVCSSAALAACNGEGEGEQTGPALGEKHADEYLDNVLPTDTYEGAKLGLIGREATEIKPNEEENGQPVDDALLRRNAKTEERYDVDLEYYIENGTAGCNEKIATAVLANESIYDVFFGNLSQCAAFMLNNSYVLSTENFPYLDLTQEWWLADCTDQLSIHNKSFFITGKIAYEHTTDAICLAFNKTLTENKSLDNHFDIVRNGQWTLDKMFENMKAVAHDDNGDTLMDKNDTWGLTFGGGSSYSFTSGAAVNYLLFDEEDEPYYVDDYNSVVTKCEKIASIITNTRYAANDAIEGYEETSDSFIQGKSLYNSSASDSGIHYRESDFYDFGFIPMPKYDEAQEKYRSWSNAWGSSSLMFPTTNQQEEMTSVVIEAMAYQSSIEGGYYDVLIQKYIKGRGTYDFDSEEMVDLIIASKVYDLDLIFELGLAHTVNEAITGRANVGLATSLAGKIRASSRSLRSFIKNWDALD